MIPFIQTDRHWMVTFIVMTTAAVAKKLTYSFYVLFHSDFK